MGVQQGCQFIPVTNLLTHHLKAIRNGMKDDYPLNGPPPNIGLDNSILGFLALQFKATMLQFFMLPQVPVDEVAKHIMLVVDQLKTAHFKPILVFDGARDPLKADTNKERKQKFKDAEDKLDEMYANPGRTTLEQVLAQQKKAVYLRDDIIYEIKKMADEKGIQVIGSPFEADSQLIALANQKIIDLALTNDSDIPYQGMPKTIMRLSRRKNGPNCAFATIEGLLASLQSLFQPKRPVTLQDVSLFACLLGNDYVNRLNQHGEKKSINWMKLYMEQDTPEDQESHIRAYVRRLPEDQRPKFYQAREHFHHGPAFLIYPIDQALTPRQGRIR